MSKHKDIKEEFKKEFAEEMKGVLWLTTSDADAVWDFIEKKLDSNTKRVKKEMEENTLQCVSTCKLCEEARR